MGMESFFGEYEDLLSKGYGIAIFSCDEDTQGKVREYFHDSPVIDVDFLDSFDIPTENVPHVLISQSLGILKEKAESVARQIILPLYQSRNPIIFMASSPLGDFEFQSLKFDEEESWRRNIGLEQILSLLRKSSFVFSSPEYLERGFDTTPMTPIEELLAGEFRQISGLEYKSQYRISNSILDFLVEYKGSKVAVECDGRGFHQKELDALRDEKIKELGYETLRFTGSEIFRNPKECALKVRGFLEKKSKGVVKYELDDNLDESQLKAVKTANGAVRVLAPAGSGKTKTLVNRIIFLINQGVAPETILAMAFNRKAKDEMQERLDARGIRNVEIRTFHSFGNQVIKDLLPKWGLVKADTPWRQILKNVLKEEGIEIMRKRHIDPLNRYFKEIRQAKADLLPQSTINVDGEEIDFPPIFDRFLDKQGKSSSYSYDDQIYVAVRLLLSDENLRREVQQRYEYVLIDEFQDLTNAQIMLAYLVALPDCNLFVVGDDDQMIYGWRGARVEHILNFPNDFPTSETTTLETNYRCCKKVVRHSNRLIKHNAAREDKDMKPVSSAADGEFDIFVCGDLYEQAEKVSKKIEEIKESYKCRWSDIGVLYRYKALQISLILTLDKHGIPHPPLMGVNLFNMKVAMVVCDYLRVIKDPENSNGVWFKEILNIPNRYLKNEFVEKVTSEKKPWTFLNDFIVSQEEGFKVEKVAYFLNLIKNLNHRYSIGSLDTFKLLSELYHEGGIRDYYTELETKKKRDIDEATPEQILDILLSVSKEYPKVDDFLKFSKEQKEREIIDDADVDVKKDQIQLYTIHASKGKEFNHVILYDLEEKDVKRESENLEEERRIAYVGMTRAIMTLFVTTNKGSMSRFIKEMVLHPKYLNDSLSEIRGMKAENEEEVKDYRKEIESINEEIPSLERRYDEIESKREIRGIEKEIRELYLKKAEAQAQLKKWEGYVVPEPEGFLKSAYCKIFGNGEKKKKNSEIARWKNTLNDFVQQIDSKTLELERKDKEMPRILEGIKEEIESLIKRKENIESKIKELLNDIEELSIEAYWRKKLHLRADTNSKTYDIAYR